MPEAGGLDAITEARQTYESVAGTGGAYRSFPESSQVPTTAKPVVMSAVCYESAGFSSTD